MRVRQPQTKARDTEVKDEIRSQPQKRRQGKLSPLKKRTYFWCYLFLLPQALMYLVFTLWPIGASWYFAFFDWNGIGWPTEFVGVANFVEAIEDPFFWNAFKNSLVYAGSLVAIVVPATLLVALILNSPRLKGAAFFRVMFILPVVLTMAIIGIIMNNMFAYQGGFINSVLTKVGVINEPIHWLGEANTAMIALVAVGAWKSFGIKVVYWLAGLQTLPRELYDAAKVDGATGIQLFRYITLPLLVPFLVIITFFQTVWALQVFDLVKTFTNGGPFFGTDVVPLYIYRYAFENVSGLPRMGFASAVGVFYGVVAMFIFVALGWFVRKYGGGRAPH